MIYTFRSVILGLLNKKNEMFEHTMHSVDEMSVHFLSNPNNYMIDEGVEYKLRENRIVRKRS